MTGVTVSQWGHSGRHLTGIVYATTTAAECQRCQNKGAEDPAAALLKSLGPSCGECTCHDSTEWSSMKPSASKLGFKKIQETVLKYSISLISYILMVSGDDCPSRTHSSA